MRFFSLAYIEFSTLPKLTGVKNLACVSTLAVMEDADSCLINNKQISGGNMIYLYQIFMTSCPLLA